MHKQSPDDKTETLRERGTLNPRPDAVHDPLFDQDEGFFDRKDLLQVKYEMLRKVRVDRETATRAASDFGFSRVAFYKALRAFERNGLAGLLPRKRGPRQGHKLTDEIVHFLREQLGANRSLDAVALANLVEEQFDTTVHPRSIERALARKKKRR